MTPVADRLERLAYLARAIRGLAYDLERNPQEFADAMSAVSELAASIHDGLDFEVRRLREDGAGIGYLCPVRAELDEARRAPQRGTP